MPVASVPAGVHETGKAIDKTEAMFSQERDPRFTDMYSGISGCKFSALSPSVIDYICVVQGVTFTDMYSIISGFKDTLTVLLHDITLALYSIFSGFNPFYCVGCFVGLFSSLSM